MQYLLQMFLQSSSIISLPFIYFYSHSLFGFCSKVYAFCYVCVLSFEMDVKSWWSSAHYSYALQCNVYTVKLCLLL